MNSYGLDIAHYVTLPMVSLDCALKKSKVELELLTDPTMHCWFEHSIRGGYVSIGAKRLAQANNPYMEKEFDKNVDTSYILYVDANNLYGEAMSQSLPINNFQWVTEDELKNINEDFIHRLDDSSETGYMFDVDISIPEELHDAFNEYPPAPINRVVNENELSPFYQLPLVASLKMNGLEKVKKLVADLNKKQNYILHGQLLKLYLQLGVKLEKINSAVKFSQGKWLKSFIDFNTHMRQASTSDFEKDFWKLLSNAVFGKTIEQVRKRQNVRVVTDSIWAERYARKPTVKDVVVVNENTSIFMLQKLSVLLDKPLYTGAIILDLAKKTMYNFHYKIMKEKYKNSASLLYTDTDSLIYHVYTDDIYNDIKSLGTYFDMSDYPVDHPHFGKFFDSSNKKVLGKFKDEYAGKVITHFRGPRPKMYALRTVEIVKENGDYQKDENGFFKMIDSSTKKVKGISKSVVESSISMNAFLNTIENCNIHVVNMKGIRSFKHELVTQTMWKRALHGLDTKRFAIDENNTLAFGHKDISRFYSM